MWLLILLLIKKLNTIVTELFIRGRTLNISIAFITQSYFKVPKEVRLNTTHFLIMKITNKIEFQININCTKSFIRFWTERFYESL